MWFLRDDQNETEPESITLRIWKKISSVIIAHERYFSLIMMLFCCIKGKMCLETCSYLAYLSLFSQSSIIEM